MKIIISNIIEIQNPTKEILSYCKKELTFNNPDYVKKQRMGFSVYKTPKTITLYELYNGNIYMPVGCFEDIWKIYPVKEDYVDCCCTNHRDIYSNIILRDYQKPCADALKKYVNGIFVLPPGLGKTQIGLYCASYLKQKTLWLTHTKELLQQAKERCENNLICATSIIGDGKCDYSGDIVFATVQTLSNVIEHENIKQDEFGLIIVDECFPKGTKINTPNGLRNIEELKIGDYVYSYNHNTKKVELNKINYLFNKKYEDLLINIKLNNGTSIVCTPNHPIFTKDGYVRADSIKEGDYLYEMFFLSTRDFERELYKKSMESQISILSKHRSNILFKRLFSKICNWEFKQIYAIGKRSSANGNTESNVQRRSTKKSINNVKKYKSQTTCSWWKWKRDDCPTMSIENGIRKKRFKCFSRIRNTNKNSKRTWLSNLLQSRLMYSGEKVNNRGRWKFPFCVDSSRTRQEKNYILRKIRVESVTIQKRNHIRKCCRCRRGNYVYNIGVENNNNYFVDNILVHNCHHLSTNAESVKMFEKCVNYFSARYKLGLTGTLHRGDGLVFTTTKILGNVIYEVKKNDTNDKLIGCYEGNTILEIPIELFQTPARIHLIKTKYNTNNKDIFDLTSKIVFSKLITDMSLDDDRNNQILSILKQLKGYTIVVSDRVNQLHYLSSKTKNSVCIDGKTSKKIRKELIEDFRNEKYDVLFASYSLVAEGLDIPQLENLIMATPIKDKRLVVQSIGRCQRPYEGKKIANIYDLIDDVSILYKFTSSRKSIYKQEGWEII